MESWGRIASILCSLYELLNIVQLFKGRLEEKTALFEYIEGFYNTHRQHSRLSHLSPVQFEKTMAS